MYIDIDDTLNIASEPQGQLQSAQSNAKRMNTDKPADESGTSPTTIPVPHRAPRQRQDTGAQPVGKAHMEGRESLVFHPMSQTQLPHGAQLITKTQKHKQVRIVPPFSPQTASVTC